MGNWPPLQMLKARVCETSTTGDIEAGQLLRACSIWSALVIREAIVSKKCSFF